MAVPKPPSGQFTILYFAGAASFTHKTYDHVPAPLDVQRLFVHLESKYPGMREKVLESCAVTVNLDYVDMHDSTSDTPLVIIQAGDEVGIIPPVSSG